MIISRQFTMPMYAPKAAFLGKTIKIILIMTRINEIISFFCFALSLIMHPLGLYDNLIYMLIKTEK